jgi:hypothetical protein
MLTVKPLNKRRPKGKERVKMKPIKDEVSYLKRMIKNQDLTLEEVIMKAFEHDLSVTSYILSQEEARERLSEMLLQGYRISELIDTLEDNTYFEYFYFCDYQFEPITCKEDLLQYL